MGITLLPVRGGSSRRFTSQHSCQGKKWKVHWTEVSGGHDISFWLCFAYLICGGVICHCWVRITYDAVHTYDLSIPEPHDPGDHFNGMHIDLKFTHIYTQRFLFCQIVRDGRRSALMIKSFVVKIRNTLGDVLPQVPTVVRILCEFAFSVLRLHSFRPIDPHDCYLVVCWMSSVSPGHWIPWMLE